MIALPPDDRFYRDGPERAATPEQALAERAYREAFLAAAREAAQWPALNLDAVRAAWHERYRNFDRSRLRVQPGQYVFAAGHEVEAARARGRVQALEAVCESWQELVGDQVPAEVVRAFVIEPWANAVDAWAKQQIDPARVRIPPFPTHLLTPDQRRALALVRPAGPALPLTDQSRLVVPRSAASAI